MTIVGLWINNMDLHSEKIMNKAEGVTEKKASSKKIVKSNSSRHPETPGPIELSLLQVENNMAG